MLSAGVSVRGALVKNIHVVSSLLVHVVLGVFFVVHTQPPSPDSEQQATFVTGATDTGSSSSAAESSGDKNSSKEKVESQSAFMALQPPQGKNSVPAKMSLARSLAEHPPRRDKELEGMLQSISFERQTAAVGRSRSRNREGLATSSGTASVAENIPGQVLESITNKFSECWTIPYDTQSPGNAVVKINLGLDPHGKVTTASIADTYLYDHDPFYRAVADSALRAVYKCSPLSSLQAADYSLWNEMVLTFDTKQMSSSN